MDIINILSNPEFWFSVIRLTTPILLATLGAVVASKAGAINIGIEGMMLSASFFGVLFSALFKNPWAGLMGAILSGIVLSSILGYFALKLKTNFVITGIAINILSSGGTIFLLSTIAGDKGTSTSLKSYVLPNIKIPLIDSIPVIGKILSGHNFITYVAILAIIFVHILFNKTRFGLRLKAVGEAPEATESVGIDVTKVKFIALLISGVLASLGGVFLSMGYVSFFSTGMTSGRGYIALAARAIANNTAIGAFFASSMFGIAETLSNYLQKYSVPVEIVRMLPYALTIVGFIIMSFISRKKEISRKKKIMG